jgi:hypothetical protein
MYCPTCGSEERQLSQYCRACGTDLRSVRLTLERPDAVTASAVSARDHISRAIADKIRETKKASDLQKVAEEVLPEIEKFLESPAEKRLRRIRAGMVMAFIGVGATLAGILASMNEADLIVLIIPGLVSLFIGFAIMLNGLLFTLPRKEIANRSEDAIGQRALDDSVRDYLAPDTSDLAVTPNQLTATNPRNAFGSVTEHTTKHLADKH